LVSNTHVTESGLSIHSEIIGEKGVGNVHIQIDKTKIKYFLNTQTGEFTTLDGEPLPKAFTRSGFKTV
jgi:hypothetical protein